MEMSAESLAACLAVCDVLHADVPLEPACMSCNVAPLPLRGSWAPAMSCRRSSRYLQISLSLPPSRPKNQRPQAMEVSCVLDDMLAAAADVTAVQAAGGLLSYSNPLLHISRQSLQTWS